MLKSLLKATGDVLLATMEKELHRGQTEFAKQDPAPYFTSYNVTDRESLVVSRPGRHPHLDPHPPPGRRREHAHRRARLDNTHGQDRSSGITSGQLP